MYSDPRIYTKKLGRIFIKLNNRQMSKQVTRSQIRKYLNDLSKREYHDEEREYSRFKDDNSEGGSTVCTTSARLVAKAFKGRVYGYTVDTYGENYLPDGIIGADCDGHDFAIVGPFLVDWWAANVDEKPFAIIDTTTKHGKQLLKRYYLPCKHWKRTPICKK